MLQHLTLIAIVIFFSYRYGKAVIRRKGQVQDQRERRDGYGGEATGIKSRVTKSVKL